MDLEQIRCFIAVLDQGSFLGASRVVGMSRTTLLQRVDALESSLGISLLVRTHRGVIATETGSRFAERARQLLQDADALHEAMVDGGESVVGELRIRSATGLPPQMIAVFSLVIRERYPDLVLRSELTHLPTRDIPPDTDLIVHFGPAKPDGPFRTLALVRFPEVLLATPAYLDERGRPRSPEDLVGHSLLAWIPPGEDGRQWPLRSGGRLAVNPWFLSTDPLLVRTLAAAGRGIALVPDAELARAALPAEQLEVVLPEAVGRDSACYLLIPQTRAESARSRAVVALMRDMAKGLFGVSLAEI